MPEAEKKHQKEVPWCTIFLCTSALILHTLTLYGNWKTAHAIETLGKSVDGWSDVGLGVSSSLSQELDALLSNVTFILTDAINKTMQTQEMIDGMLSMMGATATTASLTRGVALLQIDGSNNMTGDPLGAVMPMITKAMGSLPHFQQGLESMQGMMERMKPALLQIGTWVETFGDQVQATVEIFGTSMDKVQKLFDQAMKQASSKVGAGLDLMIHDTFNLIDMDGSGAIDEEDLANCADIYAIDALKGAKGKELLHTYDTDKSGDIDSEEYPYMVEDPSILGLMAQVLRSYAKKLSQVAGNVGAGKMRDELSLNIAQYFQLVCSKNMTKVGWIAQMLTNATLPMPFTADVMAQLALLKDDPNVLSTRDVGEIVVGTMMNLDSDYTLASLDLMATPEHWTSEGFNPADQSGCVEIVTGWTVTGPKAAKDLLNNMVALRDGNDSRKESKRSTDDQHLSFQEVVEAMPRMAGRIVQERMREFQLKKRRARLEKRRTLYATDEQKLFLVHLLNGVAATDGGSPELAEQALNKGVPAMPETLLFAGWLMANASSAAKMFQSQCFDFTGESSSPLDAFNTQIQGMVKKLSGFIDQMKPYSTPAGVEKLEMQIAQFATQAMDDVYGVVKELIMNAVMGAIEQAEAMKNATQDAVSSGLGGDDSSTDLKRRALLQLQSMQLPGGVPAPPAGVPAVPAGVPAPPTDPAGAAAAAAGAPGAAGALGTVSGVWDQVSAMLRQLTTTLPVAIETLKYARTEVSSVASTLDSLFSTLKEKGPPIFADISELYRLAWTLYFFFVFPLTLGILFYGFWASGYWGGPKAINVPDEDYEPPVGFKAKCCACCSACCSCLARCHDLQLCFWSFIIIFQIIVLLLFIVSIVFVILAGIQAFVGSGCAQIYLLGDTKVCTETMNMLATFMSTFSIADGSTPLTMSCERYHLKACTIVKKEMLSSGILTVVGSFLAAILSFQMIFDTALLHERVRWRRIIDEMEKAKAQP